MGSNSTIFSGNMLFSLYLYIQRIIVYKKKNKINIYAYHTWFGIRFYYIETGYSCIEIGHCVIKITFASTKTGYGAIGISYICIEIIYSMIEIEIEYNNLETRHIDVEI
eukprot:135121_1